MRSALKYQQYVEISAELFSTILTKRSSDIFFRLILGFSLKMYFTVQHYFTITISCWSKPTEKKIVAKFTQIYS